MGTELTQAEQDFFATGELPPELQAEYDATQQAAAVVPDTAPVAPVVAPKIDLAPAVQPVPAADQTSLIELLRRSIAEEQQRAADASARLAALEKQFQEKLQVQEPVPDPTTDPLGNMMHQLQQVNQNVTKLQQELNQEQQTNLLKQQFSEFVKSVQDIKTEYVKTTPDFNDAYTHIRSVRTEDLRAVGIPESEIPKILLQDELNISQNAIQRGKNPAEEIYNMAKRYGYAAKAAAPPADQKLANIVKGQEAAKQPGRAAPESDLTIDGLKDAGNSDLDKMVQDDNLWAKLVGGRSNSIF